VNLDALTAIPIHIDPEVPAGTAVLDFDPKVSRHITGIRVHDREGFPDLPLTHEQTEQVRDHYRAMNERAGRLLDGWNRLINSIRAASE
jgi:hypothetical protein